MSDADQGLAHEYAQAAYQHSTSGWLNGLSAVHDRLTAEPNLAAELNNMELSFAQRQARLDEILPPGIGPDVKNFLYLLLREGDMELLGQVIADLKRLSTRGPGVRVAHVTSAVPLTADEEEAFRQKVRAQFGADVELEFQVDPSILGGAIVRVGDKMIDGSVAGRLDALHERLAALR